MVVVLVVFDAVVEEEGEGSSSPKGPSSRKCRLRRGEGVRRVQTSRDETRTAFESESICWRKDPSGPRSEREGRRTHVGIACG